MNDARGGTAGGLTDDVALGPRRCRRGCRDVGREHAREHRHRRPERLCERRNGAAATRRLPKCHVRFAGDPASRRHRSGRRGVGEPWRRWP